MVKMYEICEGTFVPEECCTFHEPPEGGGHGLSVSGNDIAHLLDALMNFVPRNMADFVPDQASGNQFPGGGWHSCSLHFGK